MALKGASGGSRGLKASPRVTMATPPALIAPNCALLIAPCFSPPSFACVRVHLFIATITFHFIDGYRKQGRFFVCSLTVSLTRSLPTHRNKRITNTIQCVSLSPQNGAFPPLFTGNPPVTSPAITHPQISINHGLLNASH